MSRIGSLSSSNTKSSRKTYHHISQTESDVTDAYDDPFRQDGAKEDDHTQSTAATETLSFQPRVNPSSSIPPPASTALTRVAPSTTSASKLYTNPRIVASSASSSAASSYAARSAPSRISSAAASSSGSARDHLAELLKKMGKPAPVTRSTNSTATNIVNSSIVAPRSSSLASSTASTASSRFDAAHRNSLLRSQKAREELRRNLLEELNDTYASSGPKRFLGKNEDITLSDMMDDAVELENTPQSKAPENKEETKMEPMLPSTAPVPSKPLFPRALSSSFSNAATSSQQQTPERKGRSAMSDVQAPKSTATPLGPSPSLFRSTSFNAATSHSNRLQSQSQHGESQVTDFTQRLDDTKSTARLKHSSSPKITSQDPTNDSDSSSESDTFQFSSTGEVAIEQRRSSLEQEARLAKQLARKASASKRKRGASVDVEEQNKSTKKKASPARPPTPAASKASLSPVMMEDDPFEFDLKDDAAFIQRLSASASPPALGRSKSYAALSRSQSREASPAMKSKKLSNDGKKSPNQNKPHYSKGRLSPYPRGKIIEAEEKAESPMEVMHDDPFAPTPSRGSQSPIPSLTSSMSPLKSALPSQGRVTLTRTVSAPHSSGSSTHSSPVKSRLPAQLPPHMAIFFGSDSTPKKPPIPPMVGKSSPSASPPVLSRSASATSSPKPPNAPTGASTAPATGLSTPVRSHSASSPSPTRSPPSELMLQRKANLAQKSYTQLLLEVLLGKTSPELKAVENQALTPAQRVLLQKRIGPSPVTNAAFQTLAAKLGRKLKPKVGGENAGVGYNSKQRSRGRRADGFLMDMTPLLERTVDFLLSNGADPNGRDADKNHPLWLALQIKGSERVVKMLLDRGAECILAEESEEESDDEAAITDPFGKTGTTAHLNSAFKQTVKDSQARLAFGQKDALKPELIRPASATANLSSFSTVEPNKNIIQNYFKRANTPTTNATSSTTMQSLLVPPNAPKQAPNSGSSSSTANVPGSNHGSGRGSKALVSAFDDPLIYERGSTVDLAMKLGLERIVVLLLRNGHLPSRTGGIRLLDFARLHRFANEATSILREKLFDAVQRSDEHLVQDMLRHCDRGIINSEDHTGRTPLYIAVEAKDPSLPIVQLLLDEGADPNKRDISNTPMAVFPLCRQAKKSSEVLALLLQHGMNPALMVSDTDQNLIEFAKEAAARAESIQMLETALKKRQEDPFKFATEV